MMSHYECIVPEIEWNLSHQTQTLRQEQAAEGLEEKERERERNYHLHQHQDHHNSSRSSHHSHMHSFHQSLHAAPATSNDVHQIEELTWQKGQLAMHGHGEQIVAAAAPKPIWSSSDTLESIVNQTSSSSHNKTTQYGINPRHDEIALANKLKPSSSQKTAADRTSHPAGTTLMMKKRTRSESELCETHNNNNGSRYSKGDSHHHHHRCHRGMEMSMCGSASATFCGEEDTMMMTWASFESPRRLKTSKTTDEDSASLDVPENQDEDCKIKAEECGRSHSSRRSRVAANHNQSERRRRDRINQKMKALQMLVPNAHKTDKASMLDEVIEYLKHLQAQVNTIMNMRNMNIPQMAMIAQAQAQQQQLQTSLLSRMAGMGVGIGLGMGMLDVNSLARAAATAAQPQPLIHPASSAAAAATATFFPPQFLVAPPPHSVMATHSSVQEEPRAGSNGSSLPIPDPYCSFLAQNMNIDLYNKMAAVYRQQNIDMASPSKIHRVGREQ